MIWISALFTKKCGVILIEVMIIDKHNLTKVLTQIIK